MKIKCSDRIQQKPQRTFPRLMVCKTGYPNVVLMFNGAGHGMLMEPKAGSSLHKGEIRNWDIFVFTDYHGTVTISND